MVEVTQPPLTQYVIGVLLCSAGRARSDELKRNGATESVGLPLPAFGGERAGVIGVNITHLPVAVVLFEHLSKLSRRSAN